MSQFLPGVQGLESPGAESKSAEIRTDEPGVKAVEGRPLEKEGQEGL